MLAFPSTLIYLLREKLNFYTLTHTHTCIVPKVMLIEFIQWFFIHFIMKIFIPTTKKNDERKKELLITKIWDTYVTVQMQITKFKNWPVRNVKALWRRILEFCLSLLSYDYWIFCVCTLLNFRNYFVSLFLKT